MAEAQMRVKIIAHTQLEQAFEQAFVEQFGEVPDRDTKTVALTAIRTCYSANKPSEVALLEGGKYFLQEATDGEGGTEADRLFRHITRSGHTSTLEHLGFVFAVEGVSRALLAQLTRHRVGFSFSVQSQRYVGFASNNRSQGFDYVVPDKIRENPEALEFFIAAMEWVQGTYNALRDFGIPQEDARSILPNAAATNLTLSVNLRALLDFYSKRQPGRGAQGEIAQFAGQLRSEVERVASWAAPYFEAV